jgi:hypothetical protein
MLTWKGVLTRLGTTQPILGQNTVFHFISDHTAQSDPVILQPFTINAANICIQGELIATGVAGILAGVVPMVVGGPGQLLEANIGTPAAAQIGFILDNTTKGIRSWIDGSPGGNVAILTQPMTSITTTLPVEPPPNPPLVNTTANGDHFQILRPVKVNLFAFECSPGEDSSAIQFEFGFIQQIWGIDPSGIIGNSTGSFTPNMFVYECRFDRFQVVSALPGDVQLVLNNCFSTGSGEYLDAAFQAGSLTTLATFPATLEGGTFLGGNVIVHQGVHIGFASGGPVFVGGCYIAADGIGILSDQFTGAIRVTADAFGLDVVWGPGGIDCANGGKLYFDTSATHNLQMSGPLTLDGTGTGLKVVKATGVWTGGVALNVANIDAADGKAIFNPQTGSGFAQTTT